MAKQAATAAAAAAADDDDSAGRSCQRGRRRGRRASVGVVDDVARLQTAGATSRQGVVRDGNARHDTAASPGVAGRLRTTASLPQLTGDS